MWELPPQLTAFARHLLETIGEIGKALKEQNESANAEHEQKRKEKHIPQDVRAEIHFPEDVKQADTEHQNKQYSLQKWNVWIGGATFFVVAVYAGLAYLQWQAMNNATNAAFDAVHEARLSRQQTQRSLEASIDASKLDERAWIVVRETAAAPPELNKPWKIRVVFINTGKTPAKNVQVACHTVFVQRESEESTIHFAERRSPEMRPALIGPNDPAGAYCDLDPLELQSVKVVTPPLLSMIATRRTFLFSYGFVIYGDISGGKHWLSFCRILGPDVNSWEGCKTHNDTGDGDPPPN